jgi:hypothetical protein
MNELIVYLAKSNRADPDRVSRVRKFLRKIDNVTVAEYIGGIYSRQMVKTADVLVVVTGDEFKAGEEVTLGRGLVDQIKDFRDSKPLNPHPIFVAEILEQAILTVKASGGKLIANGGDFVNYCRVSTEIVQSHLEAIIEHAKINKQNSGGDNYRQRYSLEATIERAQYKAHNFGYNYGTEGNIPIGAYPKDLNDIRIPRSPVSWKYNTALHSDIAKGDFRIFTYGTGEEERKKLLIWGV